MNFFFFLNVAELFKLKWHLKWQIEPKILDIKGLKNNSA